MRVKSWRVFHAAITTWVFNRGRKPADDSVRQRCAFLHSQDEPAPAGIARTKIAQTLHWYDALNRRWLYADARQSGRWSRRPRRSWREFFINHGIPHKTEEEVEGIYSFHCIGPEDYDKPVSESYWQDRWECEDNPSAKAYLLLSKIDLGPELGSARGPLLEFHEGDNHPGSNDRWVNAKDQLSLSLLQARLIDLKMPIKIEEGT